MDYAKYCNEDGYLPIEFITPEGWRLGQWGANIRNGRIIITPERKKILDQIHFLWDANGYQKKERRKNLEERLATYQKKNKNFDEWLSLFDEWQVDGYIPANFVTPQGEKLGRWVAQVRNGHRVTTPTQKEKLNERNFVWKVGSEIWSQYFKKDFLTVSNERKREKLLKERSEIEKSGIRRSDSLDNA